jgi:DNA polymerase III subunit gamma/tau
VLVRIAYVADMPTPDEAIRMLEQNGDPSPVIAAGAGARSASTSPVASSPVSSMPSSSMSSSPSSSSSMRMPGTPRSGAEASALPQMIASAPEAQSVPEAHSAPALRITSFPQLVALAGQKRDLMTKAALEADVRLVRIEDGRLELALERNAARTLINDLSRKLETWTGRRWTVIVSNEPGEPTLRAQNEVEKSQRERTAEADPRVREVLARFPGAKVIDVRRLAPEAPESDANGEDPAESIDSDDQ